MLERPFANRKTKDLFPLPGERYGLEALESLLLQTVANPRTKGGGRQETRGLQSARSRAGTADSLLEREERGARLPGGEEAAVLGVFQGAVGQLGQEADGAGRFPPGCQRVSLKPM